MFGREPDVEPREDSDAWDLALMSWLQRAEGTPESAGWLRLEVDDLASRRAQVQTEQGITCSHSKRISGRAV
ncbi:hypothetical protein KSX_59240 [Ktedonospora formicarum]|uniref:Uncharacterized protein n=1 Tax=Ktedonospora formicarum TaxID=2778364 RepID=A0A8J3I5G1_9CHLR|nr:hypothetical protein KSX_59240 [Ktedonospora formicarum]